MSQGLILGSMAVATTSTTVKQIRKSESTKIPRTVFAGLMLAVVLLFLSEGQPELAESVALLIMVAALIGTGAEAINLGNKLVGS